MVQPSTQRNHHLSCTSSDPRWRGPQTQREIERAGHASAGWPRFAPGCLGANLGDTAASLPNISEYDFGRRDGRSSEYFSGGWPSLHSFQLRSFGIFQYRTWEAPPPTPSPHLTSAHPSSTISTRQLGLLVAGQQPCNQLKLNAIQTKGVYRWLSLPHSTTASWCAV